MQNLTEEKSKMENFKQRVQLLAKSFAHGRLVAPALLRGAAKAGASLFLLGCRRTTAVAAAVLVVQRSEKRTRRHGRQVQNVGAHCVLVLFHEASQNVIREIQTTILA